MVRPRRAVRRAAVAGGARRRPVRRFCRAAAPRAGRPGRLLLLAAVGGRRAARRRAARRHRRRAWGSGVMHDLAVGVHPEGADAWAERGRRSPRACRVGAPPDMYNQQGQNWSQPPWRPDALARAGYGPSGRCCAPCCATRARSASTTSSASSGCGGSRRARGAAGRRLRALRPRGALRRAVPRGAPRGRRRHRRGPGHGGAVGRGLPRRARGPGHVGAVVRAGRRRLPLAARALPAARPGHRDTHDLPPTAAYLAGEHVDLRERLGLLTRPRWRRSAPRPGASANAVVDAAGRARARRWRTRPSGSSSRPCTPRRRHPGRCSWASRSPTPWGSGAPRTSRAPTPSTPTGRSRSPTPRQRVVMVEDLPGSARLLSLVAAVRAAMGDDDRLAD